MDSQPPAASGVREHATPPARWAKPGEFRQRRHRDAFTLDGVPLVYKSGSRTLLVGETGIGKTMLALRVIYERYLLDDGSPFGDPNRFLYVNYETDAGDIGDRAESLGGPGFVAWLSDSTNFRHYSRYSTVAAGLDPGVAADTRWLKATRSSLAIYDSLSTAGAVGSQQRIAEWIDNHARWWKRHRIPFLGIDHPPKPRPGASGPAGPIGSQHKRIDTDLIIEASGRAWARRPPAPGTIDLTIVKDRYGWVGKRGDQLARIQCEWDNDQLTMTTTTDTPDIDTTEPDKPTGLQAAILDTDTETAVLLDAGLWASIEGEAPMVGPLVWGVDLGTSAAQSAIAAYWPETGALAVLAAFPEIPSLDERGRRDGVAGLYRECHRRGELLTLGRRAVDVEQLLQVALDRFGRPSVVVADRWREAELRDGLDRARIPAAAFETRGMGFKDGGEDVRQFRRACADGIVTPVRSLLLRSAMAEARTVSDPAGNSKLGKGSQGGRRLRARDDAAAAAILAVAAGMRRRSRGPARRRLRTALVG